ncbi:hypothetical protein C7N83_00375, partial [Neisseria iguanae]
QGRRVGFIDFEDNPAAALDIIQCQSRDWLCYLQSTLLILQRQNLLAKALPLWQKCFARQPQAVQEAVQQGLRPISWMRRLKASFWGRDTLQLAALARFLTMVNTQADKPASVRMPV